MTVATILRHKGDVVFSVRPEDDALAVAKTLSTHRVGAVLVLDQDGEILGIVSERDIARALAANGAALLEMRAGQLMTRVLHTVTPATTEVEAMEKMTANRVRHLPVLEDGMLVGMVSIGDVVKARIMEAERDVDALKAYVVGA